MYFDQIQRLQTGGNRVATEASRRLQTYFGPELEMMKKGGLISAVKGVKFRLHCSPTSRATRCTVRADFATSLWVLEISLLRSLKFNFASFFSE